MPSNLPPLELSDKHWPYNETLEQWVRFGLFPAYYGVEWDPDRGDPVAWEAVQLFIKKQSSPNGMKGIMLTGPVGTGKTLLAHYVMRKPWKWRIQRDLEFKLGVMTADQYMAMLSQQISAEKLLLSGTAEDRSLAKYEEADDVLTLAKEARWLMLDDLGAEYGSPWSRQRLIHLIRERGNAGKPTVLTTNLTRQEFARSYGDRTMSYIGQVCDLVPVLGADQRGTQ